MRARFSAATILGGTLTSVFSTWSTVATAQTALPQVNVETVVQEPKPKPKRTAVRPRPAPPAQPRQVTQTQTPAEAARQAAADKHTQFDQTRANILAPIGANNYQISHAAIEAMPQGGNASFDKVLLQAPGVSQDTAVNGAIHIRNEHANVSYRINGILLPDGVAGMGQILDSSFMGSIAVLTGALPAQFGLRTAAVVDITTRADVFNNTGTAGVYGGSRATVTPFIEYGGTVGQTQFFAAGRYFGSDLGIENVTSAPDAIHDHTDQGRFFGYVSTLLDDKSRLTYLTGTSIARFQIPNNPGQPTAFNVAGVPTDASGAAIFDSSTVNENQWERNYYSVLAWQKSVGDVDVQASYFQRYSNVHFVPDPIGDLVFNGVASDIARTSLVNGIQADAAYRLNDIHTIRTGMVTSAEHTDVTNASLTLPGSNDPATGPIQTSDIPISVSDANQKTGYLVGLYVQDEWRITEKLTLNTGLRFDQMWQFVDANQFSPRVNVVYKPFETTTLHAGYARYFTPPVQAIATPANFAIFNNTVNSADPAVSGSSPMLPERSHVVDVGVTQKFGHLQVGFDAYYKLARDLIDDGQFGAARVLTGFNYDRAYNWGLEWSNLYTDGPLTAWLNIAWATQRAKNIVSNQQLFTADDLAFIAANYIYTDHAQWISGSAGASYRIDKTTLSGKLIFGSGLRSGADNTDHLPFYTQVDAGIAHEFDVRGWKPFTLRFDVVNVFDSIYEIRNGSGIGVFAPEFGPRRGFYLGYSQKFGPG
jgi:outer membrane receptor protein involved in Fe transport